MVVELLDERADRIFHALGDATRRDILRQARCDAHSVSSLARRYPMSFAAVQKHVAVLESAGLVTKERCGREQLVRTELTTLREAHELLDQLEVLWRDRMERFEAVLDQPDQDPTQGATT
jgi:DNA-binding transcriptional ArsR family regulator